MRVLGLRGRTDKEYIAVFEGCLRVAAFDIAGGALAPHLAVFGTLAQQDRQPLNGIGISAARHADAGQVVADDVVARCCGTKREGVVEQFFCLIERVAIEGIEGARQTIVVGNGILAHAAVHIGIVAPIVIHRLGAHTTASLEVNHRLARQASGKEKQEKGSQQTNHRNSRGKASSGRRMLGASEDDDNHRRNNQADA